MQHIRNYELLTPEDFSTSDFTVRTHTPIHRLEQALIGLSLMLMVFVAIYHYDTMIGFYIMASAACLTGLIAVHLRRTQIQQQSCEFTIALLSAIIQKGSKFNLIIRKDGGIVFANHSFRDLFSSFMEQPNLNLAKWISDQSIEENARHQIMQYVSEYKNGTVTVNLQLKGSGAAQPVSITVDPIDHPNGYMLIHGT
jgi:PAS domain-containing protein